MWWGEFYYDNLNLPQLGALGSVIPGSKVYDLMITKDWPAWQDDLVLREVVVRNGLGGNSSSAMYFFRNTLSPPT